MRRNIDLEYFREQIEDLGQFLLDTEGKRFRKEETPVECAKRLISTRKPKIKARNKLRLFNFSKILYGMQRLEQYYGEDLCLEVLPDGSGRIIDLDTGKEFFWFDTMHQLYTKLNIKSAREELFS